MSKYKTTTHIYMIGKLLIVRTEVVQDLILEVHHISLLVKNCCSCWESEL